ncbi:MAG: hypothetical protein LBK94_06155 [Prevotellaceae bacterium]|nr:hypothetical protein [Prevotellaceae bacterium]
MTDIRNCLQHCCKGIKRLGDCLQHCCNGIKRLGDCLQHCCKGIKRLGDGCSITARASEGLAMVCSNRRCRILLHGN